MKYLILLCVIVFLGACEGTLWNTPSRTIQDNGSITISISDPIYGFHALYSNYLISEEYTNGNTFTYWLETNNYL